MTTSIPAPIEIRERLSALSLSQLKELATISAVPEATLVKLRNGQTENPRLETVRALWSALEIAHPSAAETEAPNPA